MLALLQQPQLLPAQRVTCAGLGSTQLWAGQCWYNSDFVAVSQSLALIGSCTNKLKRTCAGWDARASGRDAALTERVRFICLRLLRPWGCVCVILVLRLPADPPTGGVAGLTWPWTLLLMGLLLCGPTHPGDQLPSTADILCHCGLF